MGEGGGGGGLLLTKPAASRPPLTLPPRSEAILSPGPMSLVSSFFAEHDPDSECKTFSQLLAGAMASPPARDNTNNNNNNDAKPPGSASSSSAKFKCMPPASIPIPRPPYMTLPHGLSPSTLLDSPMLLTNSQVEPSPTTGNFPLVPIKQENADKEGGSNLVFKPYPKGPFEISHQQVLAQIQAQVRAQAHEQMQTHALSETPLLPSSMSTQPSTSSMVVSSVVTSSATCNTIPSEKKTEHHLETKHMHSSSKESNRIVSVPIPPVPSLPIPPVLVEKPSADGYNWRKYGQKQVKGSEYPRSYYKCTQSNCQVKKKVERSHNGQVTEIVYKGEHNHPRPQPTRRMAIVSHNYLSSSGQTLGAGDMKSKGNGSSPGFSEDPGGRGDKNVDGSDPSTSVKINSSVNDSLEQSSGSSDNDGNDNEPDSKRSKKEKKAEEVLVVAPLRTIREPRVVVQTRSDVDILDDGYRWRKYGQKVVKGNPHPRSYYKCTNLGCPVRKHVERASSDEKAVITTYEGKHNHDVPAIRHSSHDVVGTISQGQTANMAASRSVVTSAVKSERVVNKESAFNRISESRSEGRNYANTESGGTEEALPTILNSHSGSMQTAASLSEAFSRNEGRSLGNDDNVVSEKEVLRKPKEEQ